MLRLLHNFNHLGTLRRSCPHVIWGFFKSKSLLLISTGQPPPSHHLV